jgi:hypothetical protein
MRNTMAEERRSEKKTNVGELDVVGEAFADERRQRGWLGVGRGDAKRRPSHG